MQSILQYRRIREDVQKDLNTSNTYSIIKSKSTRASPLASSNASTLSGGEQEKPDLIPSDGSVFPGVTATRPDEKDGATTFIVGWKENDPLAPRNWTTRQKWATTVTVCLIAMVTAIPSSIDGPVADAFNEHYHVGAVAGSMVNGAFLIGFGVGSLFAGPFSETFGRNAVYMTSLVIYMLFLMAKGLAPNYGAAVAFRFLAGFFGSTPLTCAGGSIGDLWSSLEFSFSMSFYTMVSYWGPILGPVMGAYLPLVGFKWADWISLILCGAVTTSVFFFQPETYSPYLLEWRAHHLRQLTGDKRFQATCGSRQSLSSRLLSNIYRPFQLTYTEPIILVSSLYLVIIYIIFFTFLNGYPFMFERVYGISHGLTYITWIGIFVGDLVAVALIPIVYAWTRRTANKAAAKGEALKPEVCMYFAMLGGSIALPISLFWMGWTCYPQISIWVPIIGSAFFGYGLITVFTSTFTYICFTYQTYAASALAFLTFTRYLAAGGMQPVSIPMYENLGPHWTLTLLGCLSAVMAPVPYLLYAYGQRIRLMSRNVQDRN